MLKWGWNAGGTTPIKTIDGQQDLSSHYSTIIIIFYIYEWYLNVKALQHIQITLVPSAGQCLLTHNKNCSGAQLNKNQSIMVLSSVLCKCELYPYGDQRVSVHKNIRMSSTNWKPLTKIKMANASSLPLTAKTSQIRVLPSCSGDSLHSRDSTVSSSYQSNQQQDVSPPLYSIKRQIETK